VQKLWRKHRETKRAEHQSGILSQGDSASDAFEEDES